jgi:hypothetical protein
MRGLVGAADLDRAREVIVNLFEVTCQDGRQSARLPSGHLACGHYFGLLDREQRGLYGTAAAIRVLSQERDPADRELTAALVAYVTDRPVLERDLAEPDDLTGVERKLADDTHTTTRVAEVLFALSTVKLGTAAIQPTAQQLAELLLAGSTSEGWGYLLDRRGEPGHGEVAIVPTAMAVRALAAHGYDVTDQARTLVRALTGGADPYAQTYCLLVLWEAGMLSRREARRHLKRLWARLAGGFDVSVEANVEWVRGRDWHAIRLPWQLYLMTAAAGIAPWWLLARRRAQRKLADLVTELVEHGSFVYPYSGPYPSTRTHSIVYDLLRVVGGHGAVGSRRVSLLLVGDLVREAATSRVTRWVARLLAVTLVTVSLLDWRAHPSALVGTVAPGMLSALVLFLLSVGGDHR